MKPKRRRPKREITIDEIGDWLNKRQKKKEYDKRRPKRKPGRPKGNFVPYEDARTWARRLKLTCYDQWLQFVQQRDPKTGLLYKPSVIPSHPQETYGDTYVSDSDFLGTAKALYFPYDKAKREALKLGLRSCSEWVRWHHKYKPRTVPRFPDHFYDEWESWGTFLGTGNKSPFEKHKQYRPYQEAIKVAHTLNLKTRDEWITWHKAHVPIGIPRRPDIVYDEWEGWDKWLGKTIYAKLEVAKTNTTVLYIAHHRQYPSNVFEIALDKNGRDGVIDRIRQQQAQIIKIYQYDDTKRNILDQIIAANGSKYQGESRVFLVRNLSQLLWDLDSEL
jgi:hypothetical protein